MFEFQEKATGQFWLEFHAPFSKDDEEAYLASLHALSAVDKAFVVVAVFGGDTHLSDEARKSQNLWFKEKRETLGLYCKGLVRVSPHYEEEGEDTSNYGKAMPFPVINVRSIEMAQSAVADLISEKGQV